MVSKSHLIFFEYMNLYQRYYGIIRQLHRNIQTILNFYGVNIYGDNHNQNRTAMQEEARDFMLEWIHDYIIDYFDTDNLDDEDVWQLAEELALLFMSNANDLTEDQLYNLFVDILLPNDNVIDYEMQFEEVLTIGPNTTEVYIDDIFLQHMTPTLLGVTR